MTSNATTKKMQYLSEAPIFRCHLRFWFVVAFALGMTSASAQLKVYPLPAGVDNKSQKTKSKNTTSRTQEINPRSLPFWDDFSWTQVDKNGDTLSNYPVDSLWLHNNSVWINNGLGLNPPSINVATFNGLNASQSPYSDQILANGFRDTLMSQPIRLDEVATGDRNSVYLSFFYQWAGNGEPPDPDDYLQVEFKNDLGAWENAATIRTKDSFEENVFYDTLIKVDGERFFHETFQFRFKNYGRLSGPYDTWHLDYVYLNKNRTPADKFLPDRSIISTLTNLFSGYRAIPYDHFLENRTVTQPTFDVFNIQNDTSTLSYSTQGTFKNYKDGAALPFVVDTLGNSGTSPIDGATGVIFQRQRKTVTLQYVPDPNDADQFNDDADSVMVSLKVQLFTGDTFNPKTGAFANDYDPSKYQPLDFRSNDTLRADYMLADYYAYDDGYAEYSVGLTAFGNRAAYLFDMLNTAPDTLLGFDIYYPDYGVTGNLTVDFTIYNDDNGSPGIPIYTLPSYSIQRTGPNKFQKVRFGEQFLVEDKFYIGWKAPVGGTFKVGLDTNNDSGANLFVNTNGTWIQNTDIAGSVMIRPVFGKGNIVTGLPEEELQSQIFPNPNDGKFFVPVTFNVLDVISVTGQRIGFTTTDLGENQMIRLATTSRGIYIVKLKSGDTLFSTKLIVK
jgi:hypothetical protein